MMGTSVTLVPLTGLPEVQAGDDLAALLHSAVRDVGGLVDGDVLVMSSKVVSKAMGLRLAAREEAVRRHTVRVVAERVTPQGTAQVVESAAGPVMAAAGVDASNTGPAGGALLLPEDPDAAARDLHSAVARLVPGVGFGLILSDTAGRPWRAGQVDFALGACGVLVLDDLRGGTDADGRPLAVTQRAVADEIAAAADLVKGKSERVPAALVRGLGTVIRTADRGSGTSSTRVTGGAGQEMAATGGAGQETAGGEGVGPMAVRALLRTGAGDWFRLGHREAVRSALGAAPGTVVAHEVGVPSAAPEPDADRAARAVRLALLGHPGAGIDGAPAAGFTVTAHDPVTAGRVAARLEVALAGEGLVVAVVVAGHD